MENIRGEWPGRTAGTSYVVKYLGHCPGKVCLNVHDKDGKWKNVSKLGHVGVSKIGDIIDIYLDLDSYEIFVGVNGNCKKVFDVEEGCDYVCAASFGDPGNAMTLLSYDDDTYTTSN